MKTGDQVFDTVPACQEPDDPNPKLNSRSPMEPPVTLYQYPIDLGGQLSLFGSTVEIPTYPPPPYVEEDRQKGRQTRYEY